MGDGVGGGGGGGVPHMRLINEGYETFLRKRKERTWKICFAATCAVALVVVVVAALAASAHHSSSGGGGGSPSEATANNGSTYSEPWNGTLSELGCYEEGLMWCLHLERKNWSRIFTGDEKMPPYTRQDLGWRPARQAKDDVFKTNLCYRRHPQQLFAGGNETNEATKNKTRGRNETITNCAARMEGMCKTFWVGSPEDAGSTKCPHICRAKELRCTNNAIEKQESIRSFEMCAMECEAHNILHRLRGDILGPGRVRRPQCRWFSYSQRTSECRLLSGCQRVARGEEEGVWSTGQVICEDGIASEKN